jgi:hypothetical protein
VSTPNNATNQFEYTVPWKEVIDVGAFGRKYLSITYQLDRFPKLELVRLLSIAYESPPDGCTKETVEGLLYPRGAVRFEDIFGFLIPDSGVEWYVPLLPSDRTLSDTLLSVHSPLDEA